MRPPPFARRLTQRHPSEATRIDRGLERPIGIAKARRKDGAQLHAGRIARLDDTVAALACDFQRLFDDDMFPRSRRGNGRLLMRAGRRRNDDDVNVFPLQHRRQVRIGLAGKLQLAANLSALAVLRPQRGDPGPRHIGERASVKSSDHAAADNGATERVGG